MTQPDAYHNLFQKGYQSGSGTKQSIDQNQAVHINSAVLNKFIQKPIKGSNPGVQQPKIPPEALQVQQEIPDNPQDSESAQNVIEQGQFVPLQVPAQVPKLADSTFHQPTNGPLTSFGTYNPLYGQDIHYNSSNTSSMPDITIQNLFITSDFFLKKAHSLVLITSTVKGSSEYVKMIKLSIKALVMICKKYSKFLDPWLELIVCYKLAKIYFTETENINRADDYVNRAITISIRNNLIPIRVLSEFLAAQILEVVNNKLLANYLNEKIVIYGQMGYKSYSDIFLLLKLNNSLSNDVDTGLILLQNITRDLNIHPFTRLLGLIYQSNLHLYRGSPIHSALNLNEAESIMGSLPLGTFPTQFTAMMYLLRYLNYIHTNNINKAKEFMLLISSYLNSQQSLGWSQWLEDGSFQIITGDINFKINWLTSDEFVVMFYFLTGVNLLTEISNGKKKSKKVFDKCLQIIEKLLKEVNGQVESTRNYSITKLRNTNIRLRYIKYSIHYYQSWMGFLNNEFNDINFLNEFMTEYNSDGFGEFEEYFNQLLPRIFYLFAAYYQFKGDIQASKYYYMKVRNLTKNPGSQHHDQLCLGIGGFSIQGKGELNELFVYSTLHLLIINEYEVREISKNSLNKSNELVSEYFKVRGQLHKDLTQVFTPKNTSNSFAINFTGSNDLLKLTYHLLLNIFNDTAVSGDQYQQQENVNKVLVQQMGQIMENFQDATSFPFITNLINYLIYIGTDNMEQKNRYLDKCMSMISISSGSDNDRIISIFILKSLIQHFRESGENDKASMAEMQLEYFYNSVRAKFEFLRGNIDCEL